MTKSVPTSKKSRKQYTPEFRDEALKLAERIGVAAAARELNLYESQLYNWRSKQKNQMTTSEREWSLPQIRARLNQRSGLFCRLRTNSSGVWLFNEEWGLCRLYSCRQNSTFSCASSSDRNQ